MGHQGQRYTEEYKRAAVQQAESSGNVSQTARELGISTKSLHGWIRTYGTLRTFALDTASQSEMAAQIRQLEKQLAEKERQIEVLKKAISIVSQAEGSAFK